MDAPPNARGSPADAPDAPGECGCPVCETLDVLGRKWSAHVLGALYAEGPLRFNALQRRLGGVSARVLSDRLKELEALGLVERVDHGESPPRVEYRGTAGGAAVLESLEPFVRLVEARSEEGRGPARE